MIARSFLASCALALLIPFSLFAVEDASPPTTELAALTARIKTKLKSGQRTVEDLAPELNAFDALLVKYKDVKTDEVAQIAFKKAELYARVLKDAEKSRALLAQIKTDFPGTATAAAVAEYTPSAGGGERPVSADKAALVGKLAPELHFGWSSQPGLKTLSSLKGKVVVIDFWATWCGPCVGSFPKVRELVEHYKDSDVVVLGVTSIQGKVSNMPGGTVDTGGDLAKEMELMPEFMKFKNVTWPVVISDEKVFNPDYAVNGIPHVAIIAPDGTVRHNGLHPAMSHAKETEMIDAILTEFGRKVPEDPKA